MNVKFFRRIVPVVSKGRLAKAVLAVAAVVAVIFVGRAWGTTGSGSQSTLLGRATFDDPINVRRVGEDNWKVDVKAKPALDVAVQSIVFQPGSQSGWHSHPGPVFISVVSGTMTFYEGNDPDCEPIVRHAGEGYLDTGDHAHIARNETGETATNVVTYFAPPGAALRIDQPAPGNCPF
jgi:hypothetical protein